MSVSNLRRKLVSSLMSLGSVRADSDPATDLGVALKLAGTELLMSAGAIFDRASDIDERRVSSAQIVLAKAALAQANEAVERFERACNETGT